MSSYNQHQEQAASAAYPPPPNSYAPAYVAPPPVGYPTKDGAEQPQKVPIETKSRGDKGFWEGCCAALCCCCVLETCF